MAYAPELLILVSVDIFLVMSLLACMFDIYFPTALPYLLQLVSLAGFGQIYVSKVFLSIFTEDIRFWYGLLFLLSGFVCVLFMNGYLIIIKRKLAGSIIFLGGATIPTAFSAAFILSVFINKLPIPLFVLAPIPLSTLYLGLAMCLVLLCSGALLSLRPEFIKNLGIKITGLVNFSLKSSSESIQPRSTIDGLEEVSANKVALSDEKTVPTEIINEEEEVLPFPFLLDLEQVLDQDTTASQTLKDRVQDAGREEEQDNE